MILFKPEKIGGWYDIIKSVWALTASCSTRSVKSLVNKIFFTSLRNNSIKISNKDNVFVWIFVRFTYFGVVGWINKPTLSHDSAYFSGAKRFSFSITSDNCDPDNIFDWLIVRCWFTTFEPIELPQMTLLIAKSFGMLLKLTDDRKLIWFYFEYLLAVSFYAQSETLCLSPDKWGYVWISWPISNEFQVEWKCYHIYLQELIRCELNIIQDQNRFAKWE